MSDLKDVSESASVTMFSRKLGAMQQKAHLETKDDNFTKLCQSQVSNQ